MNPLNPPDLNEVVFTLAAASYPSAKATVELTLNGLPANLLAALEGVHFQDANLLQLQNGKLVPHNTSWLAIYCYLKDGSLVGQFTQEFEAGLQKYTTQT